MNCHVLSIVPTEVYIIFNLIHSPDPFPQRLLSLDHHQQHYSVYNRDVEDPKEHGLIHPHENDRIC